MKNVLITGGAGYLGRGLLKWLATENVPVTVFSRDTGKHEHCRRLYPDARYIVGDVRDYDSVESAIAGHDTVIHAAAFKYVPQGETNAAECHAINVTGSLNVARAAVRMGVERVIGISTDKACLPVNVYGLTKLMMERLFQEADNKSDTKFNLVRYGNVVSSTGSAVPIFRQQARDNNRVMLSNPDMTRFWLSVSDAVILVRHALREKEGGTVLIPRLPSMDLVGVAKAAMKIEFGGDNYKVEFLTAGHRHGEKVHESLLSDIEGAYAENIDGDIIRLYPMTSKAMAEKLNAYSSDHPDRALSIDEMVDMINEAKEG